MNPNKANSIEEDLTNLIHDISQKIKTYTEAVRKAKTADEQYQYRLHHYREILTSLERICNFWRSIFTLTLFNTLVINNLYKQLETVSELIAHLWVPVRKLS